MGSCFWSVTNLSLHGKKKKKKGTIPIFGTCGVRHIWQIVEKPVDTQATHPPAMDLGFLEFLREKKVHTTQGKEEEHTFLRTIFSPSGLIFAIE